MLKKFCKEYLFLVIVLMLLGMAGILMIFLGAFTDVSIYAKYFLVIAGIACLVGSVSSWFISLYEFEKLEMLMKIKEEFTEDERTPVKIYKNGELPYEMSDRYLESREKASKEN